MKEAKWKTKVLVALFLVHEISRKGKRTEKADQWLARVGGVSRITANGRKDLFKGIGNVLKLECGMVAELDEFTKIYWNVHLQQVNFMMYNLCLNKVVKKLKIKQYRWQEAVGGKDETDLWISW